VVESFWISHHAMREHEKAVAPIREEEARVGGGTVSVERFVIANFTRVKRPAVRRRSIARGRQGAHDQMRVGVLGLTHDHIWSLLVDKGLLPPERARMLRGWVHSGFNVHRGRRMLSRERGDMERRLVHTPHEVVPLQAPVSLLPSSCLSCGVSHEKCAKGDDADCSHFTSTFSLLWPTCPIADPQQALQLAKVALEAHALGDLKG
jgi:hypothetical protein